MPGQTKVVKPFISKQKMRPASLKLATARAVSRFVGAKPQQTDAMHLAATHLAATHQAVMADAIRVVVVLVSEAVWKASDAAISAKSGP